MKIAYFDVFRKVNSNYHWLQAFKKCGIVRASDVKKIRRRRRWNRVLIDLAKWSPTHIHLGGSTKNEKLLPLSVMKKMRQLCPKARMTIFYGDVDYPMHQLRLLPYVDAIYMTNMCYTAIPKVHFLLHPSSSSLFYPLGLPRKGVVFVGNNTHPERMRVLCMLSKVCEIDVYGRGWRGTGIQSKGTVLPEECNQVYNSYEIVLGGAMGDTCCNASKKGCIEGDPDQMYEGRMCRAQNCSFWEPIVAYLSNRPTNIMMSGSLGILMYRTGLEYIVREKQEIVWGRTVSELSEMLRYYLEHPEEGQQIATRGLQRALREYTFEAAVDKIMGRHE